MMTKFVSFNGDSVWWNTDLFHTIGIGFGKYGLISDYGEKHHYSDTSQRDILGFRNKREGGVVDNETIVLYSGKSQHQCEKVIEAYTNAIKNTDDIPDRIWLEAEHESYDPNLFHKIESVRFEPYDGHNSVAWTEYNVWGRYIDPNDADLGFLITT